MKKGLMGIVVLIFALVLVGCSSNALADIYSEDDVIAKAKEVVDVINTLDYDAVNAQLRDDLQDQLTAEQLEEVWSAQLSEAGAFEEYTNTTVIGQKSKSTGEDYATAILTGKYENASLTFTIVIDKDMEIVGMYLK
jgi:uncharacterized lipoprotein YmbA